jgi:hypothetical protein
MAKLTKTERILVQGLIDAAAADEEVEEDGSNLAAGMVGTHVSNWIRRTAAAFDSLQVERKGETK